MPEKWRILLGHPIEFWAAMAATSVARSAITGENIRSALISVPATMTFSYVFTRGILSLTGWPADPGLFLVGGLVIIMAHPVIRALTSITSLKDLASAVAEIVRAWRGK